MTVMTCQNCGHVHTTPACPLCTGQWETWELQYGALPMADTRLQMAAWLSQLPNPCLVSLEAVAGVGLRVFLSVPPGTGRAGAIEAFAALHHQQSRWKRASDDVRLPVQPQHVLVSNAHLPSLAAQFMTDPILAIGGGLLAQATNGAPTSLKIWFVGKDQALQERVRALGAYSYGTESGVDADTPNPWGWRLSLLRAGMLGGGAILALSMGAYAADWLPGLAALTGALAGGLLFLVSFLGLLSWMQWRSLPKTLLEKAAGEALLKVSVCLTAPRPDEIALLSGATQWRPFPAGGPAWPAILPCAIPLRAGELAGLFAPPEMGDGGAILARQSRQDVPAPPPSLPLIQAPFRVGVAVATEEGIGVDPDGHGMAIGGTRTGKSSFVAQILRQLVERGPDAPGLFLVDPHLSLADALLHEIDNLPPLQRAEAVRRLRVITPDQPEVIPLNLLAVPDFAWAGNAIVQAGRRIWEDYWGPRMQAALLGLFRLAHAWNMHHPNDRMGLLHTVFAAFNTDWRRSAAAFLPPAERLGTLALDALLGQTGDGKYNQSWVTEVISPVMSKVMGLELAPWLFAAMHQPTFADLEGWIKERAWVILRLPAGSMGSEGARLTAGILYNVFEAAFRKAALNGPIPYYFIIDEAQEIATAMRLEALLSEGAKFGARVFVLAQSLALMRRIEGFEPVVQSLLANTSTQAFFSPDPEDADLIRATLSATVRYGETTLDLPTLNCWLRARIGGAWQPPTLLRVEPLRQADPVRVQALLREVIAAHPEDYFNADNWQEQAVRAMQALVPFSQRHLLNLMLTPTEDYREGFRPQTAVGTAEGAAEQAAAGDTRKLGF